MAPKPKNLNEVIDEFAARLLERLQPKKDAEGNETGAITLDQELQIFKELTRWVQIKHKINPDGGEGEGINDIARQLGRGARGNGSGRGGPGGADGETAESNPAAEPIYSNGRGRKGRPDASGIGEGIQALIAKKPPHDDRGSGENERDIQDDGDDSGYESSPLDGDAGSIHPGAISGN